MSEWTKKNAQQCYLQNPFYKDTSMLVVKGRRTTALALRNDYQAFVLLVNLLVLFSQENFQINLFVK